MQDGRAASGTEGTERLSAARAVEISGIADRRARGALFELRRIIRRFRGLEGGIRGHCRSARLLGVRGRTVAARVRTTWNQRYRRVVTVPWTPGHSSLRAELFAPSVPSSFVILLAPRYPLQCPVNRVTISSDRVINRRWRTLRNTGAPAAGHRCQFTMLIFMCCTPDPIRVPCPLIPSCRIHADMVKNNEAEEQDLESRDRRSQYGSHSVFHRALCIHSRTPSKTMLMRTPSLSWCSGRGDHTRTLNSTMVQCTRVR